MVKSALSRKSLIRRLDNLARDICKELNNYTCQRCGVQGNGATIQWAHIERRSKKGEFMRWDQRNCLALCAGPGTNNCHYWFDNNKIGPTEWLQQKYPDKYNWLHEEVDGKARAEALSSYKLPDLLDLEQELKTTLKSVKEKRG